MNCIATCDPRETRARVPNASKFPDAKLMPDPYAPGQWRAAYTTDIVVEVPVLEVVDGKVELELTQQGCRKGLCWPITITRHEVAVVLTEKMK